MSQHSIIARLGAGDRQPVSAVRRGTETTEVSFVDGNRRLGFGIGQAMDQLREFGLRPSEIAVDLVLLAASVTAADTRISRHDDSQDHWTREIDLHVPVSDPALWQSQAALLVRMLDFLTGDRWSVFFRPRPAQMGALVSPPAKLRTVSPTCVSLFSGGLDSFIGAIDLISPGNESPLFVSHYWDGITSQHQTFCMEALRRQFAGRAFNHIRARVGFPNDLVATSAKEDTLRARSFLFFALAVLAASTIEGDVTIHVPENGLISLNVPLDPMRLGALSTRTTHPFYMARFNDLLRSLGIPAKLENRYRHRTKGQMVRECAGLPFLRRTADKTMSCSAPTKYRFSPDETLRKPMHCGHCVPCLIRRAALLQGAGDDATPYTIANLHTRALNSKQAEGRDIRSFQLAIARLASSPSRARFDIHRPGPLLDHPNDLAEYEAVYVNGLREVGHLLTGVRTRPM